MESAEEPGYVLGKSALGNVVSEAVTAGDVERLLLTASDPSSPQLLHPPEFKHCSHTGVPLTHRHLREAESAWCPPFGVSPTLARSSRATRGLQQTNSAISLHHRAQRRADDDSDATSDLPPHGDFEFFSLPAGTRACVLIALDPRKGVVFGWMPASQRWEQLEHSGGGLLAGTSLIRAGWRCEVTCGEYHSTIFLPTDEGLACVEPDALGLSFNASYIGKDTVVGAPVQFGERIWAPARNGEGGFHFISATLSGEPGGTVDFLEAALRDADLSQLHAPLADTRTAIWPCDAGQLVLRKQASGALAASFVRWPEGVKPAFEFGSPFLARDGGLWQLCFDSHHDSYFYFQMGVERPEFHQATAPRLCTGSFNFRFAAKYKSAPWQDPEHGDDSSTDEVVLPLLESVTSSAVLGVKLETTEGLANVMKSSERMRVVLVLDDDTTQTAFYTVAIAEVWRLRVFIHDCRLWLYHPLLTKLVGWDLEI
jgi:hypothetical protein